jgi:hypothetical protein
MSAPREKDLSDLEKLLAALPPRPTTLDRDHLLFRAGQASMRRSWIWPFVAVVMSATAGCLAMFLVLRPPPEPVVQIVRVQVPVVQAKDSDAIEQPEARSPAASGYHAQPLSPTLSYWRMQQQALRFGVEGLPSAASDVDETPSGPATANTEISAGSRPKLFENPSFFSFGAP